MSVIINDTEYETFADIAFADNYLAGDLQYAEAWDAATPINKARALVGATRKLAILSWKDSAPSFADTPEIIKQACVLYAAAILSDPTLTTSSGTGSNIKSVSAGPVDVEFFTQRQEDILPLPSNIWNLLLSSELLTAELNTIDIPIYTGGDQETHFTLENK